MHFCVYRLSSRNNVKSFIPSLAADKIFFFPRNSIETPSRAEIPLREWRYKMLSALQRDPTISRFAICIPPIFFFFYSRDCHAQHPALLRFSNSETPFSRSTPVSAESLHPFISSSSECRHDFFMNLTLRRLLSPPLFQFFQFPCVYIDSEMRRGFLYR